MRIGIVGAGQLGRMMALAGIPLGIEFAMYDRNAGVPGAAVADIVTGEFDDRKRLARFAQGVDVVTFDWENVPVASARAIAALRPVWPPPRALEVAQDRISEKKLFRRLGIPVAPFAAVDSTADLARAIAALGAPGILKTRRLGYDGKGQIILRESADAATAWAALGDAPLILEGFVPFERELSILAARSRSGETACFPLIENHHRDGILRLSLAPAPGSTPALQSAAEQIALRALAALDYVGVLAIELFQVTSNEFQVTSGPSSSDLSLVTGHSSLVVNEMAPRVHNSGHWTIEGAETSQFEQHLRAVLGLPLGATAARGFSAMVNLIGALPDPAVVLAIPGAHLHLYGKQPRAGRKLGHITIRADERGKLEERLARAQRLIE
jgi:5-(carboxyamino)imidazole ribonucleotide synthase